MELQKLAADFKIDKDTLQMLETVLEQEREEKRRRQAEGIARAKARGVHFGRPRVEVKNLDHIYRLYMSGEISVTEAAKLCGLPRSTVYRKLREYDDKQRQFFLKCRTG